jgi:hypothetical protein
MVYFALVGLTLMALVGFVELFKGSSAQQSYPIAANIGVSLRITFLLTAVWLLYTNVVVA